MKALDADGFEIGNHTRGHYGSLSAFLDMEDELASDDVPKPTTVCWPLYAVSWDICPTLTKNGYTFGRGGHDAPIGRRWTIRLTFPPTRFATALPERCSPAMRGRRAGARSSYSPFTACPTWSMRA